MNIDGYFIGVIQLMFPMISGGAVLFGFVLFLYLHLRYHNPLYGMLAVTGLANIVFAFSEVIILIYGSIMGLTELGFQANRIQQLAASYLIFGLPALAHFLLKMNDRLRRLNRVIIFIGGGIFVAIILIAFLWPNLFVSLDTPLKDEIFNKADTCRGQTGIVYTLRDLILSAIAFYAIVISVVDMKINKRFRELIVYLIAIVVAIMHGMGDMYFMFFGRNLLLENVHYSRFSLGVGLWVLLTMGAVFVRFLNHEKSLLETREVLKVSQQRNSVLIERTNDCLFTLSPDLKILGANTRTRELFGWSEQDEAARSFIDILVPRTENSRGVFQQLIEEKMSTLRDDKKPVTFVASVLNPKTMEPEDYRFCFEHFETEHHSELIGRAYSVMKSRISQWMTRESLELSVDNYLFTIDEICNRLTLGLKKYLDSPEVQLIKMGLREMILNAMEHGNLNITFEEKVEATAAGRYLDLFNRRQRNSQFAGRRVTIDYRLDKDGVYYRIEDEGEGFDPSIPSSGRGIMMSRNIFDSVEYNRRGNQVSLTRSFHGSKSNQLT